MNRQIPSQYVSVSCCSNLSFVSSLNLVCIRCHDPYQIPMRDLMNTEQLSDQDGNGEEDGDPGAVIVYSPNEEVHRALALTAVANLTLPPVVPPRTPLQQVTIYGCCSVMLIAVNRLMGLAFCTQSSMSGACAVWEHSSPQSASATNLVTYVTYCYLLVTTLCLTALEAVLLTLACFPQS